MRAYKLSKTQGLLLLGVVLIAISLGSFALGSERVANGVTFALGLLIVAIGAIARRRPFKNL